MLRSTRDQPQYSHLSINLIIILKTILFNEKSYLKILQVLLQANQSVRIHMVVICISRYYAVNLPESVNTVNVTCKPINNILFVVLAVSTHAHIWFIRTYYSCTYMPSQTARRLNTCARANQNARVQFVQTKNARALFVQSMMHTAAE